MPPRLRRLLPEGALTRRLAVASLINTFGNGLFMSVSALFFTRVVGLSVAHVGLGLTVAGGFGVVAGVPIGRLADRIGTRPVYGGCVLVEAGGLCTYPFVHSIATFLPVVCLVQIADRGGSTVRNALIATVVVPDRRAATRAYLRAVTNVGIGAGAAFGAVALQADTRGAYLIMIFLDAATFIVTAVVMSRLPSSRAVVEPGVRPVTARRALRDRPYLTVTALSGVIAIQFGILEVGLPLWVAGHTHAPRVLVSIALLMNTVLVVLLQVRAARGMTTPAAAARSGVRASVLLAASCLLFGAAHGPVAWVASALIVGGVVVGALAEVLSSASGWTLGYDLADPAAPGLYQGVFQTGFNLGVMLAPLVLTSTAIRLGLVGWGLLGALFVAAGLALVPATRWAERARADVAPVPVG